jgi:hypothetical protein
VRIVSFWRRQRMAGVRVLVLGVGSVRGPCGDPSPGNVLVGRRDGSWDRRAVHLASVDAVSMRNRDWQIALTLSMATECWMMRI